MTNQVIPEAAVEAAAKAIDASKAEGCGCCAYPEFTAEEDKRADELDINVRALLIAKEALEAAAPYMLADAWDDAIEAHKAWTWDDENMDPLANPYRPTP